MAINKHDLLRRILAGSVYVAITAACTLLSWVTTVAMVAVTAGICCHEFLHMAEIAGYHPETKIGTATAALIPVGCCVAAFSTHAIVGSLSVAFVGSVIMLLRFFARMEYSIVDMALTVFGVLYTGLLLSSFVLIRGQLDGIEGGVLGLFVLVSVWINDGAAYLGGSAFGKHKFVPRISPKKTWEGVFFGLAASVITWLFIPLALPEVGFGYVWAALSGLIVGVAAIIGDLTESHIKRSFGVKDAGRLLPGHGGLLDRSDSMLLASCVAYAMIAFGAYLPTLTGVIV